MKRGHKRTRQLGSIEREILQELSAGDIFYGFLLSGRSSRQMFKLARERANYRFRRKKAIERLSQNAYIKRRGDKFSITGGGYAALGAAADKNLQKLQTKAWDHKWRIVVYDIPVQYSPLRTRVRTILKRAGFHRLQQSIWIFPHDCEDLVQLIRQEPRIAPHILYGVLERIEGEQRIKNLFRV